MFIHFPFGNPSLLKSMQRLFSRLVSRVLQFQPPESPVRFQLLWFLSVSNSPKNSLPKVDVWCTTMGPPWKPPGNWPGAVKIQGSKNSKLSICWKRAIFCSQKHLWHFLTEKVLIFVNKNFWGQPTSCPRRFQTCYLTKSSISAELWLVNLQFVAPIPRVCNPWSGPLAISKRHNWQLG